MRLVMSTLQQLQQQGAPEREVPGERREKAPRLLPLAEEADA